MKRRTFISSTLATGAALAGRGVGETLAAASAPVRKFKLKYAPHFGMFKNHSGEDLVDQLKFMHDQGFTALEDNGLPDRSVADQERIGNTLAKLGMEMGVFVATKDFQNPTMVLNKPEIREKVLADIRNAVEVAKRVNAKWCTVVPGCHDERLEWDYQMANVIDNFRRCAEICEKANLIMVMEPLNNRRDHPKLFLTKIPQAYAICRGVNSPTVKILFDMYHQQITEGNILFPGWGQSGTQGADDRGDELPEHLQAYSFKGLHRCGRNGARQFPSGQGWRAGSHRRLRAE
jgi:hydroxypyruvate isomerase